MEGVVRALPRPAMRGLFAVAILASAAWGYARLGAGFSYAGTPVAKGNAPPLVLPDDRGGIFDLSTRRGGITLVYFGYTHCPDVCPATLGLLDAVARQMGPDAGRVTQVFVTLDPYRDTQTTLHEFLSNFDPVPIGLTGSPEAIAVAARAWNVTWRPADGNAFFDHTSVVAVIGPDGRQRLRYGFSQLGDAAAVARDLQHVLHES